jgi:hypothetical protein
MVDTIIQNSMTSEATKLQLCFSEVEEHVQTFSNLVKGIIKEEEIEIRQVQTSLQNALYAIEDYKRFAREADEEEKKKFKKKFEELEIRFYILDHEFITIQKRNNETT